MGRDLAVEQVFSSLGFRRVLAVEKFLPGKPSVPFFKATGLQVSGVKLMEINSNCFSR